MRSSQLSFAARNPVLLAALSFIGGICATRVAWRPASWMLAGTIGACVCALVLAWRRRRLAVAAALVAAMALGTLDAQLEAHWRSARATLHPFTDNLLYTISGTVVRSGAVTTRDDERVQSIDVMVEQIDRYGDVRQVRSKLRATVADVKQPFMYGERVRFDAQLREANTFHNPGAFDYRAWLAEQGITALATVEAEKIERRGAEANTIGMLRSRARHDILQHISSLANDASPRWYSLSHEDVVLLSAMTMGERSEVLVATKEDFQRTGSFHLLVVSGMNVAIFAVAVFWVARRLPFGEFGAIVLTALFAISYASLTDLAPPVMRAVAMALIFLIARLLNRSSSSLNAIGAAALVILALQPSAVFEASFQMTFLSVLAILAVASPLLERTIIRYHRGLSQIESQRKDFALDPEVAQFRIGVRLVQLRLRRIFGLGKNSFAPLALPLHALMFIAEAVVLSLTLQFVMALPTAIYFHRITTSALVANTLAVPLMELLMPAASLTIVASYGPAWSSRFPAMVTATSLHGISRTISFLGALRWSDVRTPDPAMYAIVGCIALLIAAWTVCYRQPRHWRKLVLGVAALSAIFVYAPRAITRTHERLEVTAIDVGQGDSLLVVTPDGKTLLIDSGGPTGGGGSDSAFDFGENVVSPYLWHRGIARLDAVAITHGHSDHMQGMASVITNFRPRELWIGTLPPSAMYAQVQAAAERVGTVVRRFHEGDEFAFGATTIEVLAPARGYEAIFGAANDDSLSLWMHYGSASALLSGDAERASEARIATHLPRSQFLKIDHHGSASSTIPAFLDAVSPQYAVISVGAHNHFGHPRMEVLQRLEQAHVLTHRTDTEGAVEFLLAKDGSVTSERAR